MSLQIWLPLNGNLYNQGLYNTNIISNNNIQINNNGKIGSCYYFNGTTDYIKGTYYATDTMSFCLWVKFIGESTVKNGHLLDCRDQNGSIGYQPMYIHATQGIQVGGIGSSFPYIPYIFQVDTWYHIGVIYSPSDTKLYINGKLEGYNTTSKGVNYNQELQFMLGSRCNNTTWQNVYVNDFRIYDHCLSMKEIEEVSKGLVLHYKLDNVINNIIYDCSGYNHNGQIVNQITPIESTPKYSTAISIIKNSYIKCTPFYFNTNQWTISHWYYKPTNPTTYECFYCLSKGNGADANKKFAAMPNAGRIWYKGESGSASISQLQIGAWTFLTLVCNGTTVIVYQNGEQIGSFAANTIMTDCHDLGIGVRANSVNFGTITCPSEFMISDFRIYATALTQTQIQELYNTSMAIDNKGNGYVREINEDDLLNIDKKGIFHSSKLIDGNNIASITKTKQLKVNNFYEY